MFGAELYNIWPGIHLSDHETKPASLSGGAQHTAFVSLLLCDHFEQAVTISLAAGVYVLLGEGSIMRLAKTFRLISLSCDVVVGNHSPVSNCAGQPWQHKSL